ncbi:MAG: hypothetical protein P8H13_02485 [Polaribacter sp.]|nr:hypothetical protein [Polaribacter sp.]MDG1810789.1 hypothetical protein [Polaribacter sp.]MDG1993566.1 hypothetical protein [Polaribacter sp.]
MKAKHLAITLLFFIGITTAQAQRGDLPDAKEQAKKSADEWKQEFGLSDDQHTKVYDILVASSENMRKKFQDLRGNGGGREEMMSLYTKTQEDTDKKLKGVFTDAQWPKYLEWKKENTRIRGRRRN